MKKSAAAEVIHNARYNDFNKWNRSPSSSVTSDNPNDASCRIYDGYATVKINYSGELFKKNAAVYAMGSCFAREIEATLIQNGGHVVSVDNSIDRDEFRDGEGKVRNGFFHRFTPRSIWQEFMWCFDQLENWQTDSLIIGQNDNDKIDLNYWPVVGSDRSLKATLVRREIAKNLVKNAAKADIIILTLGLIEAWYHKASGLYANYGGATALARHKGEFEFHLLDHQDTLQCLEEIYALLQAKHETGNFRLVITVSPVPLQTTFTNEDIIIANANSKAILRAAAAEFVARYDNVDYFPSYEMVCYSSPELAWRPDRVHVNPNMVVHIVNTFQQIYYQQ